MTWGTVSIGEVTLVALAALGMLVHCRGLRESLRDRRALRAQGLNGARHLLVRGHIRGHALRIAMNGTVLCLAVYLMMREPPSATSTARVLVAGLLVIVGGLLIDGVLDAADWRRLEQE